MSQPPQGVKISAYIFFAQAALTFLGVCALIGVAGLQIADTGADESLVGIVFGLCIVFVFVLLYAGVGYGLLQLQSWSRIAAIVLAILSLCNFPIGTILGGIVLYFMFQQENAEAFS
jgi:hypothetical protein